jgi:putative permease
VSRRYGAMVVFLVFVIFVLIAVLALFPLLTRQLGQLFLELPDMISSGQKMLMRLPERYPDLFSEQQVKDLVGLIRRELTQLGQRVVSYSVSSVRSVITLIVYVFLVPFLVFFFLKDKSHILRWLNAFLPEDRTLAQKVWRHVDKQIGNYIRGKVWEILIVWAVSYATFALLGLRFAVLLSFFTGLSVLFPYIGAMVMGIPVILIGYFQWGWGSDFVWVAVAYAILQFLDGNILVPLLFSEVVNLHPVGIIVAVLLFGGLWGFWGLFFSIPLATLVQAILKAWPRYSAVPPKPEQLAGQTFESETGEKESREDREAAEQQGGPGGRSSTAESR